MSKVKHPIENHDPNIKLFTFPLSEMILHRWDRSDVKNRPDVAAKILIIPRNILS
jgi:hypothetical protein